MLMTRKNTGQQVQKVQTLGTQRKKQLKVRRREKTPGRVINTNRMMIIVMV